MAKRVLVVEDNELNLKLFCDLLRAHGFEAEPVPDGREAVARARGFVPQPTWSCHWLRDPEFHRAVGAFLTRETRHVDAYMDELEEHVPYRQAPGDAVVET